MKNEALIKLEPVVSLRTGKVVAYEVLYRDFNREAEKAFASIDEEWDYEIFLSNVLTLRHMLENGVLPEPHRFLLNIKPSTLLVFAGSIMSLIEMLPFVVILELREDWIRDKELVELASLRKEAPFLLSLDDFGKGASNIDRIITLEPNLVKLDLEVLNKVPATSLLHLVESIKGLKLPLQLVAEKVETQEHLKKTRALNIGLAQGYLLEKKLFVV